MFGASFASAISALPVNYPEIIGQHGRPANAATDEISATEDNAGPGRVVTSLRCRRAGTGCRVDVLLKAYPGKDKSLQSAGRSRNDLQDRTAAVRTVERPRNLLKE